MAERMGGEKPSKPRTTWSKRETRAAIVAVVVVVLLAILFSRENANLSGHGYCEKAWKGVSKVYPFYVNGQAYYDASDAKQAFIDDCKRRNGFE